MSTNFQIDQISHNKDANNLLQSQNQKYKDWEITTLFYTALHLVDEFFIRNQIEYPSKINHHVRNQLVETHLNAVYADYHLLSTLSIRARYTVGKNVNTEDLVLARALLDNIEAGIP